MSQFSKLRWLINSWLFLSFYLFFLSKQSDAFGTWETKTTELINPMETSFWQWLSLSNTQSPKAASLSRRKMFLDDHVDNKIFFFQKHLQAKNLGGSRCSSCWTLPSGRSAKSNFSHTNLNHTQLMPTEETEHVFGVGVTYPQLAQLKWGCY